MTFCVNLTRNLALAIGLLMASPAIAADLDIAVEADLPMNGIAVTETGRKFVSMPQWGTRPSPSVAEIQPDGSVKPFPGDSWNAFDPADPMDRFVNVNAVHYDGKSSLWVVDYAAPFFGKQVPGAQKLVKISLETNRVERVYRFSDEVLPKGAKLNDVRVDPEQKVAYLSEFGVGALIVVDLETGQARRLLDRHFSVRAHPDVVTTFEGKPFSTAMLQVNDIELTPDRKTLFFQPTGGPVFWQIPTDLLRDPSLSDETLGLSVQTFARSLTIGGVTSDDAGNLYLGDVQNKAVVKMDVNGNRQSIIQDDRLLWPDAMDFGPDGKLYIPCPQLRLLSKFNDGEDLTRGLFRVYVTKHSVVGN